MSAAVLESAARPVVRSIVAAESCDVCFGTGQIFAKPGVLVPCPNGCSAFSMISRGVVASVRHDATGSGHDLVKAVGCLECMHDCGGIGCGCTCCCSYLPAVTPGGAR